MAEKYDEPSGCLAAILGIFGIRFGPRADKKKALPFRQRDDFLSYAERSLFGVLQQIVGNQAVICPKVRIADLLYVAERRNNMAHVNRIERKHVDFVLCSPDTVRPLVIVELDDASHARTDRTERDLIVDEAFMAAGLPVVRITAKRGYVPAEVASRILPFINAASEPTSAPATAAPQSPPACPKCGAPMVLRTASQGARAGSRFLGCTNFPRCKSIVPVAE